MEVPPGSYLAFNERKAVTGGRRPGRSRAFRWFGFGFGFSGRGRSFPVERVLLADSLQQGDVEVENTKPWKMMIGGVTVRSCYLVI